MRQHAEANGALTPLPAGTRLLHIGPHKTGTTAIQGALFAAKDTMSEHGVDFPSHSRHPMEAVLAACAHHAMMGDTAPTDGHWRGLLHSLGETGARTSVVSSEFFADAPDEETIARIVDEWAAAGALDGQAQPTARERVHVLVTVRPLCKIMPSQWQQYVQNGLRSGYEDWLAHMLRKAPYEQPTPSFWRRHRHDRLVERWARVVGPERVTVVVVPDGDRDGLMRTFEALLGLPDKLLQPVPDTANRSLTPAETEMLRNLNVEFRGQGLPDGLYSTLVRNGAVMRMKNAYRPAPRDGRIATPPWAVQAAAEIGAETAERIGGLGVRVIGDISVLGAEDTAAAAYTPDPRMAPEAAAQALYGALAAAAPLSARAATLRSVHQTSSAQLVRVLGHRCLKRLHLR
jgi:hypothetical protein